MKNLFLLVMTMLTLASCYKDPQSRTIEGNGFDVQFLFEKDGVKVLRSTGSLMEEVFITSHRGEKQ